MEKDKDFKALTVNELIKELQKCPNKNATVILSAYNGHVGTYACADHIWNDQYDVVSNDFFGTPGRMDKRLFDGNIKDFTFIGTMFGECPNESVDIGDDDTNTCIELLNGENGDPEMIWKHNNFEYHGKNDAWLYKSTQDDILTKVTSNVITSFTIEYACMKKILTIVCKDYNNVNVFQYKGYCFGIEDLHRAMESCHINKHIVI